MTYAKLEALGKLLTTQYCKKHCQKQWTHIFKDVI